MSSLVVVTGGSAGLGAAVLAAASQGAYRVDVSRTGPPTEADEHLAADLADPTSWPVVADAVARLAASRSWARISFVHAAGTLEPIGFAGEVGSEAYTANVVLNSAAGQVLGHGFLAAVTASSARRELVLVSSGAARNAYPGWSAYGAGKAAGDQWVRTVGAEQQERGGVRVLSVAPGVLDTGMQAAIRATDPRDFPQVERFHELHERGALVAPAEAARRLWSLLDDDDVPTGSVVDLRDR